VSVEVGVGVGVDTDADLDPDPDGRRRNRFPHKVPRETVAMSLESAEIMMDIEDACGVELLAAVNEPIHTIRDLAVFVHGALADMDPAEAPPRDIRQWPDRREVARRVTGIFAQHRDVAVRELVLRRDFGAERTGARLAWSWRLVAWIAPPLLAVLLFVVFKGRRLPWSGDLRWLIWSAILTLVGVGMMHVALAPRRRIPVKLLDREAMIEHLLRFTVPPGQPCRWNLEEVEAMVITIVAERLAYDPAKITPESRLVQDLGMD